MDCPAHGIDLETVRWLHVNGLCPARTPSDALTQAQLSPRWDRAPFLARGALLVCEGAPVAMCSSPDVASDMARELSARSEAAMPIVRFEVQRREDVVKELRLQLLSLENQLVRLRNIEGRSGDTPDETASTT